MRAMMIAALAAAGFAASADAALKSGATAADFTTRGALAGKVFTLNLKEQLKKGPVVLYFFPAAFTPGCSAEARAFAEHIGDFKAAGASVIGMSADPVDKLADFSTKDCANKFPVASAGPRVISDYDVALTYTGRDGKAATITNRTSYVIAPDGHIIFSLTDPAAGPHVQNTLDTVRAYAKAHPTHS
ncbi:peroxiredoxin [Sphingomonas sp. GlSt437]|uniref:peroxiredoxin n=1 Tax=Sphingomonas sp. GlSt437 TaxID=3389970 RepID=UPI003A86F77A